MERAEHLSRIRLWLGIFIAGLVLSGVTAFPLVTEMRWLEAAVHISLFEPIARATGMLPWVARVHQGVAETNARYPFLAYGTDWLAFGHLVIATAFIGAWRDPMRNRWLITLGLIACAGVIPLAMIAGAIRGIPLGWRLIDCSFGVLGSIPLLICRRSIVLLEEAYSKQTVHSA